MVEQVDMSDGSVVSDESDWWRLAPAEVLRMQFPITAVGRRGLQAEPVEQFRRWVLESFERAGTESAALRAEIERLHLYIRSQWSRADAAALPRDPNAVAQRGGLNATPPAGIVPVDSPAPAQAQAGPTATGQALEMLTRAQAIADQRIAAADARAAAAEQRMAQATALVEQAEKRAAMARDQARHSVLEADTVIEQRWTRAEREIATRMDEAEREIATRMDEAENEALDVVARACVEYEDILTRAHRRAEHAAERALEDFRDEGALDLPGRAAPADLEMKAAYLQTFARVSGAALRATLDITRQEFQRLRPTPLRTEPELSAYRIFGTGEIEVISGTPPIGLAAALAEPRRRVAEHVRTGALLSGVIRPSVPTG